MKVPLFHHTHLWSRYVTECKFVFLRHSEAKQTEIDSGAEEGFCKAKQGEQVAHAQQSQTPW